jgi:hypothetical protein
VDDHRGGSRGKGSFSSASPARGLLHLDLDPLEDKNGTISRTSLLALERAESHWPISSGEADSDVSRDKEHCLHWEFSPHRARSR